MNRKLFLIAFCFAWLALVRAQENQQLLITIPDGIGMVLRDSRLIKIAFADKDMAFQDSLLARSALLPQLNATLTQTYLKNQVAAKFGSTAIDTAQRQSLAYGFDFYQTLFDFGRSLSVYKASQEGIKASKANLESVKRLASLEFVIGYFDLLEAEKMITVVEKETESLSSYLNDIQHLYEQGAAIKNDLLPAKVKLADAKQRLIVARNAKTTAAIRLNNILSLPLDKKIAVQDIEMAPQGNIPELEKAWNIALVQRPEIAFFNERIKASVLTQKAKAKENFPTVFVDTGYQYQQNKYMLHDDNLFLNLGLKANLLDGGAARAGLLKERYRQGQLSQQRDKLVEDIEFEIQNSYLGLKDANEKVVVASDALEQAKENVRVNRIKYSEGTATTTDVLEAITLETTAQTNYYNADYELKRSYAKLMYSMGIDLALVYDSMRRKTDGADKNRAEKK